MIKANINLDANVKANLNKFIKHLLSLSIIGAEVKENEFKYLNDFDEEEKVYFLVDKNEDMRFRLNTSLIAYLECEDVPNPGSQSPNGNGV